MALTFSQGNPHNFLPMRTCPYRNVRIIHVIRDMFFTGGTSSFANRFRDDFPVHLGNDGVMSYEVPIAMVALVATAVRATYDYLSLSNMSHQLYAAIKEWDTGTYRLIEFSTSAFTDVYNGHVNTFKHLRANHKDAFHVMMSDIYSQAR
jgi:hypothetical protein